MLSIALKVIVSMNYMLQNHYISNWTHDFIYLFINFKKVLDWKHDFVN